LKALEPEAAKYQREHYEEIEKETPDIVHHAARQALTSADTILNQFAYKANPNGSWEAWSTDDRFGAFWDDYIGGVDVWDPKTKRWGNSDYQEDSWLDSVTGIENWRENAIDPTQ
jgi:hypothetical protein